MSLIFELTLNLRFLIMKIRNPSVSMVFLVNELIL